MLCPTKSSQVSPTVFRVFKDQVHLTEHLLSNGSQLVHAIGVHHHLIRNLITGTSVDVAGTVTTVVRYIERLLALWCRRQVLKYVVGIGVIVARGIGRLLLDDIIDRLRLGSEE